MKCSVCKAGLRANAIFCDTCGNKIAKQDVASTLALPRSQLKSNHTKSEPAPSNNTNALVLLSGAALVIIGAWLGATFLSAEPRPVPREDSPQQIPVVLQNPTPLPTTTAAPEPPKVEPTAAPIQKTGSDDLVNPFKKKKEPTPSLAADPFAAPSGKADADSVLNPFKKKSAPPSTKEDLTLDPFGGSLNSKNSDATMKPRFNSNP